MNVSHLNVPLLTAEDAAGALREWLRLARKREEIEKSMRKFERQLDAILEIVPTNRHHLISVNDELDGVRVSLVEYAKRKEVAPTHEPQQMALPMAVAETFPEVIHRFLRRAPNGMTHRELMDEICKTDFKDRVERSEAKSYYNALSRAFKRGTVIKHGDRLYHHTVHERLVSSPEGLPDPDQFRAESTTGIVIDVLTKRPGMTAAETKQALMEISDEAREKFGKGYLYNVLSRLTMHGKLVKDGAKYYVSEMVKPRGNGASGPLASGTAR